MTKSMFQILIRRAEAGDANARVIVERIKAGLPLQGGKPVVVEGDNG